MAVERPSLDVAVIMRKERVQGPMSRWQEWRWRLDDVILAQPGFGTERRLLYRDDEHERWLHPGHIVELYKDDGEGYYLNVTTPDPCWFVMWRMQEPREAGGEPWAQPEIVTLSYHDAGRWLDAQEFVEQVPAPAPVIDWLKAFIAEHYVPEPRRRKRPASFQNLQDRFGNRATVSTIKKYGRGGT